jgi:hypothetical protein
MNLHANINGSDPTENWTGSPSDQYPDLPELLINPHDPTATAKELAGPIARGTEFLFNGNAPVRITAEDDEMPRAIEATNEAVRVVAHQLCVPIKLSANRRALHKEPVPLSAEIAALYLNGLEGRWGLKMFRGITTAPILSDNGEIRTANGYDSASRLWCYKVPNVVVPDRPTQDDALRALNFLRTVFRTFPFADGERITDPDLGVEVPGLDESSFLVGLITAVCRQSLDLAPGLLCNAPSIFAAIRRALAGCTPGAAAQKKSPGAWHYSRRVWL